MRRQKPSPKGKRQAQARNRTFQPVSDRSFEAKTRAFHAIARMRHGKLSLEAASREEGTTPSTVIKYLPAALCRSKSGRWVATQTDKYVRYLTLPGVRGPVKVRARGSEEAKLASAYLQSLGRWAKTEKSYEIASFHGKKIGGHELITAARALRPMRDAGLLQLDSLYAALKDVG